MLHDGRCQRRRLRLLVTIGLLTAGACGGTKPASTVAKGVTTTTTTSIATTTSLTTTTSSQSGSTTSSTSETTDGRSSVPTSSTLAPGATSIDDSYVRQTSNLDHQFVQTRINGVDYSNALLMRPESTSANGVIQLDAGRSQTRFVGDLGIPDSQEDQTAYTVVISVDNAAPVLTTQIAFGQTKPINLNITNALRLKITITSLDRNYGYVAIGSPQFG